jgi:hypothetical protein
MVGAPGTAAGTGGEIAKPDPLLDPVENDVGVADADANCQTLSPNSS